MNPVNGYRIAEPRPHESGSGIGPANEWKIIVGLIPGYQLASSGWFHWLLYGLFAVLKQLPVLGDFVEHVVEIALHVVVRRVFNKWRMERATTEKMWVTGFLEYKDVLYTHKRIDGTWANAQEPVAFLEGIQSPLLNADIDAWKQCVVDLATTLGRRLRQTRVYVQIGPEIIVFELLPEART